MAGVNPQMVVRIVANIEQLKKALAEGTSAVTTTTAGFSKLANSLDGSRLIQQGHNITAVVNRLGDATKLTDAEAKRLRDTLDKVIDKAQRMGTEIPPDILRTRDALVRTNAEVDKMPSKMSGLVSSLKSVAGAMGVAFSVGAVVGFGKEIFRMGDQITLMADKTGMSSTEVQRLGFVADQSSVSMESIVGAVQNLQQRLGDGDTGAVGAIKALGTNTSNFLALGPYEQFLRLAEGIGSIEDPTRKATLEAELFGRAWKEIGPAVTSQIRAIANEAPVMSDNTRKALDAAGDAWSKFTLQLKVWVAELYNVMGRSFDRLVANLYKGIAETIDGFAKLASLAEKVPFADRLGLKGMSGYFDEQARWYRDAAKGLTTYTDEGKKAAAVVTALASNTKHAEVAGRAHTKTLRLSESAAYSAADANKKLNEMMREQIALLPRVKQGVESMGVGTSGPLVAQMATLGRSPLISPVVTALKRDMEALNRTTDMGAVAAHQFIQSWDKLQKIDAVTKASNGIGELSSALSNLAQVSGGAFGGIVSGLASVVAAIDSAQKAKEAFSAGKAAGGLEGFVGMASGILGMASAAIAAGQALKGMWDAAFGSKGRDLVKDFAGTVGGFDALRAQLATLGPEGEKLWIALTQGVGRNNPKQAQDAIDAVKAALAKTPAESLGAAAGYQTMAELEAVAKKAKSTYDYLVESGKYSSSQIAQAFKVYQDAAQAAMSDSARAAIEASGAMTAAIQKDLAALTSSRDSLVQSIANEAPEAIRGVIEMDTLARIAQVEAEMQAKQSQLDAAAEAGQAAIDQVKDDAVEVNDYVRELFGKPMRIPIEWDYAGMQGGFGGSGMPSQPSSSASSQTIIVPLSIDGDVVAQSVVRTSRRYNLS